jgi:hypothetical protein
MNAIRLWMAAFAVGVSLPVAAATTVTKGSDPTARGPIVTPERQRAAGRGGHRMPCSKPTGSSSATK